MIRKLYSARGTLLGTIIYPDSWDDTLCENGCVRFSTHPRMTFRQMLDAPPHELVTIRTAALRKSFEASGAVRLEGITLEEFEQIDGCTFMPGAGYLRSIIEGG